MSTRILSNMAGTASSTYPAGMEAYVSRVLADGGQINDFAETYAMFKAIEDAGLYGSSSLVCAVGAPMGVKVSGGFITKLYDMYSASRDFTPANTAGGQCTLDNSLGHYQIVLPPAGGGTFTRACLRAGAAWTGVAGPIGLIAAFHLNNPTSTSFAPVIAAFETVATTNKEASIQSVPTGDGKNQLYFQHYSVSLGNLAGGVKRKSIYVDSRFYAGLFTSSQDVLFQDGVCQAGFSATMDTYYVGKSLAPTIGNEGVAPDFNFRSGIWFNGSAATVARLKAITASLATLP